MYLLYHFSFVVAIGKLNHRKEHWGTPTSLEACLKQRLWSHNLQNTFNQNKFAIKRSYVSFSPCENNHFIGSMNLSNKDNLHLSKIFCLFLLLLQYLVSISLFNSLFISIIFFSDKQSRLIELAIYH